ncbi:MAG: nucleoside deaminase [Alphaproteobacteria bacterium]|jgi:tRNA(adenine34) deaminase|nr:nucleoside deaminase [Alphaproteobacteria bacterium]
MKLFNNKYMELAILEAEKCLEEIPVGCVIVNNTTGEILAVAKNQMLNNNDPTAHAEILAIQEACTKINNYRLEDTSIFITLEPCKMCMEAIKLARITNVYFGAYSYKTESSHNPNVIGGFYEKECSEILNKFFQDKRETK